MNAISFLLVLAGVLLSAGAQLMLKAGTNSLGVLELRYSNLVPLAIRVMTEYHILLGLSFYILSVGIWIVALSRVEVSVAYPMSSIGYVIIAIAAWSAFGETLSILRMSGIVVIILGVYMVARG